MICVRLIGITKHLDGDDSPEALIARAGRVCYKSEKKDDLNGFIRARIREGRTSVLQLVSLVFEISGISRLALRRANLARFGHCHQEPQRRVDIESRKIAIESVKFVIPPGVRGNVSALHIY